MKQRTAREARTWMTLLTNDSYLPGVLCLARGLRRIGSKYPLAVLHTGRLSRETMSAVEREGLDLISCEAFTPAQADKSRYLNPSYAECWTKLRMWQLDEYARIGYLDADLLPLQNFDEVLDYEGDLLAARDCFGGLPEDDRARCPQFHEAHNRYFNAGFMVFSPNADQFDAWATLLDSVDHSRWRLAEQDFLNEQHANTYVELPSSYNMIKVSKLHHPEQWDLSTIKCVHLVQDKPWQQDNPQYATENALWWATYNQVPSLADARLTDARRAMRRRSELSVTAA